MPEADRVLPATTVVTGSAMGPMLALHAPLSFWGGLDADSGRIIEKTHPQHGESMGGKVLLLERGKGSSSSSSVLAEAIRNTSGPAAIVMCERDLIVALGCIVASELYGIDVPIVIVDRSTWTALRTSGTAMRLGVDASADHATITVRAPVTWQIASPCLRRP